MPTPSPERNHIPILTYLALFLFAISYFLFPGLSLAIDPTAGCTGSSATNPEINTGLGCIPTSTAGFSVALLKFLVGLAGGISLIIMLIAVFQIMTGGDNAEQVKKGKELFTGAVAGLLFIIFSVTILRIVAGDIIKLPGFIGP